MFCRESERNNSDFSLFASLCSRLNIYSVVRLSAKFSFPRVRAKLLFL